MEAEAATITISSQPIPNSVRLTASEEVSSYFILQSASSLTGLVPSDYDYIDDVYEIQHPFLNPPGLPQPSPPPALRTAAPCARPAWREAWDGCESLPPEAL
jgi:hypothetical protein